VTPLPVRQIYTFRKLRRVDKAIYEEASKESHKPNARSSNRYSSPKLSFGHRIGASRQRLNVLIGEGPVLSSGAIDLEAGLTWVKKNVIPARRRPKRERSLLHGSRRSYWRPKSSEWNSAGSRALT
jgi:hypothetical protein